MRLLVVALVLAASLVSAAPASAELFLAYGTGLTNCSVQARDEQRLFGALPYWRRQAETNCDVPVQQTLRLYTTSGWSGGTCTGYTTHCFSGEPEEDDGFGWIEGFKSDSETRLTLYLRAPAGQGWVGSPQYCTGIGTDNLRCEFPDSLLWSF